MNTGVAALRVVLYEGPGAEPLPGSVRLDLLKGLLEKGYAVVRALHDEVPAAASSQLRLVLGRFLNGVRPSAAGAGEVRYQELGESTPEEVIAQVETLREELSGSRGKTWKPWFPVIDYDRCTNCMQCLSFCLFDVYGVDQGKIQVRNQSNCKTDCPACSRVCPEVAILFPKYRSGPINGDDIDPEDLRREAMKVDISALLGGDIYQMLRDRSAHAKSRFSKERDEDRALKERQRCLVQLQKALEIPPEVLGNLPSPQEIKSKAAAAQARAAEALQGASSTVTPSANETAGEA